MESPSRRASFWRVLRVLAATAIVLVVAGVTVVNILAENVLSPMMMSRGLSISPTVVFLSFVFWAWLLGGPAPSWPCP